MTRTSIVGLGMVGGAALLLAVAVAAFVRFDRPGLRGAGIGAALGVLNLAVGLPLASRALRASPKFATGTLVGGFLARIAVLVSLVLWFQRTGTVDEVAFALTFLALFFVYLAAEILLVERSLARRHA